MKKFLFPLMLLLCMSASMSAQTIVKGDMNDDGKLSVADVTSTVNVILGKQSLETISLNSSPYTVDNTLVVGTWYKTKSTKVTFNADGTTDYPYASTYEFMPTLGRMILYDEKGNFVYVLFVNKVTDDYIYLNVMGSTTMDVYTKAYPDESGTIDGKDYVDLNLPSGTLWAAWNVGASSPEEYGDFFAWGETEGSQTYYNWRDYAYCKGTSSSLTKYCYTSNFGSNGFTDDLTELDYTDDAAFVNWGRTWRTPSMEQFKELINSDYTTSEWTSVNGVYGRKITSKKNGNSIFLPAAGQYTDAVSSGDQTYGYYWSRTLAESNCLAGGYLYFTRDKITTNENQRYLGRCVRAVR